MAAFVQIAGRGKAPAAVAAHHRGADGGAVIVNSNRRARFRGAGELRTGIVGAAAVVNRAGAGVDVVSSGGNHRGCRGDGIHHEVYGGGRGAGIARGVGGGSGDAVAAVTQRGGGGKAPATVGVHFGGADRLAVVIEGDGGARFANAAKGRAGVIGALAVADGAGEAAHVVGYHNDVWRVRGRGIRYGKLDALADVTGLVGGGGGKGLAVFNGGTQIDGEVAVAVGLAGADDIAVGIAYGHRAVGLCRAGNGGAIRGNLQVSGRVGGRGIRVDRRRIYRRRIIIAAATTAAAAAAGSYGDTACHRQPAQNPGPDGGFTAGARRAACQQGLGGGNGFVVFYRQGIFNPPQRAVRLLQHQLAAIFARGIKVFQGNGFAGIEANNQIVITPAIASDIGASDVKCHD